jgi:hypothetical protein
MNNQEDCNCQERFISTDKTRMRLPLPLYHQFHSCTYVKERNKLIQEAARFATEVAGEENGNKWTAAFAPEMDRLWKAHSYLANEKK